MIGTIFKYIVIGVLAVVGVGIALSLLGIAFGLAMLAIKVGVVVLIGYGVVKLLGGGKKAKQPEISEADRRWLES
ncbi:MAG: hypothetical protein ACT4O1_13805 [Gemmatimonadota bacterium]